MTDPGESGDHEVWIEVAAAGVCGSDVHARTAGNCWIESDLPLTEWLPAGRASLEAMVTHVLPLAAAEEAFDVTRTGRACKVLLRPDAERREALA